MKIDASAYGKAWEAMHACDWKKLKALHPKLLRLIKAGVRPNAFLITVLFDNPKYQRWAVSIHTPKAPKPAPYTNTKPKIGYLSGHLKTHATLKLMQRTLADHDHTQFDFVFFDITSPADPNSAMVKELRESYPNIVPLQELGEAEAAQVIRDHKVDILVDLMGHTIGSRPGILTHSPAPSVLSYLGYPGTNGPSTDYAITDKHSYRDDHAFYEDQMHLPHFYLPFLPKDLPSAAQAAAFRADLGLKPDDLLIGCLNSSYKITQPIAREWKEILKARPDVKMAILATTDAAFKNLSTFFQEVDAQVIFFRSGVENDHRIRIAALDLFLDTTPVCAHTVALDCAAAGVPMLTMDGASYVSGVAASLNHWMDVPALNCAGLKDYRSKALALIDAPTELPKLSAAIAAKREGAFVPSAAKGLEEIYRQVLAKQ